MLVQLVRRVRRVAQGAGLAVALVALLATGARADAPGNGLVLVVSPDSVRILSGMELPVHVRVENRGDAPVLVPAPSGERCRAQTTIVDVRPLPGITVVDRLSWSSPDDRTVLLFPSQPIRLEPHEGREWTEVFLRNLRRPGIYRLVCSYDNTAMGARPGEAPVSCSLRSNTFVVRVDPVTGADMLRLAADPDPIVRARACSIVEGWGTEAERWSFLQRALWDSSAVVRFHVLSCLQSQGSWRLAPPDSARAFERERELLLDPDPNVRHYAGSVVGRQGPRPHP